MSDKPIPNELILYHRSVLAAIWGRTMRWFAISRGEEYRIAAPHELQNARNRAEQYFDRFEKEVETLLHYLRSNGDIQITGPEESVLKRPRPGKYGLDSTLRTS
jgi:hypothetical protein